MPLSFENVNRQLGQLLSAPASVDPFSILREPLTRAHPAKWFGRRISAGHSFVEVVGVEDECQLRAGRFSGRVVARGSEREMMCRGEELLAEGGPFGCGDNYLLSGKTDAKAEDIKGSSKYVMPAPLGQRRVMPSWKRAPLDARGRSSLPRAPWVSDCIYEEQSTFESGFLIQRRWFPGKGYRVMYESPSGRLMFSFIKTPTKPTEQRIADYLNLRGWAEAPKPWAVRCDGETLELRGTQLPGLIGYATRFHQEVFLCELGWRDYALLFTDAFATGRLTRCVRRGNLDLLERLQVGLNDGFTYVPRLGQSRHLRPKSWRLPAFTKGLSSLNLTSKQHALIKEVTTRTSTQIGAKSFRELVWALLLLFQDGIRGAHTMSTSDWYRKLVNQMYLTEEPATEARRHAKKLLGQLGFVTVGERGFAIDFDAFAKL